MATFTSRRGLSTTVNYVALQIVLAALIIGVATSGVSQVVHARTSPDSQQQKAYLNRINKPAIKTIQSEDGDIVDCVDILKQPAFDHPLLKNHTVQLRPSFLGPKTKKKNSSTTSSSVEGAVQFEQTWRKSGSCPVGTVPIRRVGLSELRLAADLESFGSRRDNHSPSQEQAGVKLESGGPYYGARAYINNWGVSVQPNEWSHSAIEISDSKNYYIEAGLLVNPAIFGDGQLRLYTYWTADGYHNTGCYNTLCSGFVQVSQKYVVGLPVKPLSVYDGEQHQMFTEVLKDIESGHWWLKTVGEPVGYWPNELFGGNYARAEQVKWIGSILNTWKDGVHTSTQMGSGRPANEGWAKAAYFGDLQILDASNHWVLPPLDVLDLYNTYPGCYSTYSPTFPDNNTFFYYGGSGGPDCSRERELPPCPKC